MQCNSCGQEVPNHAAFCPQCGAPQANMAGGAPADNLTADGPAFRPASRGTPAPEKEIWTGSYSPKAMVGPAIGAAVLTAIGALLAALAGPVGGVAFVIGLVVVWGGLALVLLYRRLTVRYRLTTYRFFHDTGLLSRVGNRVEVIDIDDVTVHQGLIERMLGVGTIIIRSSDATDPELRLPGIEEARTIADLIDSTRRSERQRRGMFMENV